jgi:hypothetical protein
VTRARAAELGAAYGSGDLRKAVAELRAYAE